MVCQIGNGFCTPKDEQETHWRFVSLLSLVSYPNIFFPLTKNKFYHWLISLSFSEFFLLTYFFTYLLFDFLSFFLHCFLNFLGPTSTEAAGLTCPHTSVFDLMGLLWIRRVFLVGTIILSPPTAEISALDFTSSLSGLGSEGPRTCWGSC